MSIFAHINSKSWYFLTNPFVVCVLPEALKEVQLRDFPPATDDFSPSPANSRTRTTVPPQAATPARFGKEG
jgi:hypothetical protein